MYSSKKGTQNSSDILNVVNRLEKYDKYQKQLRKKKWHILEKKKKKLLTKIKKHEYKKIYSMKPVMNPYVEVMFKATREGKVFPVDRNLEKRYNSTNLYSLHEFRHLPLPRSNNQIKAGQAWGGLIKAWKGYKISRSLDNDWLSEGYANATQRFSHILELPLIPEFEDIGVTLKRFEKSLEVEFLD